MTNAAETSTEQSPPPSEVLVRDGIIVGYACKQKAFQNLYFERTGDKREFDPRVFQMTPSGSRILVAREEAPEEFGDSGLIVPENVRQQNPPGAGWVIGVGDMVGKGTAPHPHGIRCLSPKDLLYKRIIFGMYGLNELVTQPYRDGGFETRFWVLTERDIWFVDWTGEG